MNEVVRPSDENDGTTELRQEIAFLRKALHARGCSDWVIDRWERPSPESSMTPEDRAERVAEAIIAIGQGKSKPAPTERLSERQSEERHRMVQAQRLK